MLRLKLFIIQINNNDFTHFSNMNQSAGDSNYNQWHYLIVKRKKHKKNLKTVLLILVSLELLFKYNTLLNSTFNTK